MGKVLFLESAEDFFIERVISKSGTSMPSRHIHSTYEVYFLMEGERYVFVDKDTYHVKAQNIVFIKKDQIHRTGLSGKGYYDRILMQIDEEWMNPYLHSLGLPSTAQYFDGFLGAMAPPHPIWSRLCNILQIIEDETRKQDENFELIIKQKLAEMLLLLQRCRQDTAADTPENDLKADSWKHRKVNEIAEYLTANCHTQETLEELAKRFFISKSYLTRIFREVSGLTIREYVNLARVTKAKQYLIHTTKSITAIAEATGFASITYFERIFKRYSDISPLKYRTQNSV